MKVRRPGGYLVSVVAVVAAIALRLLLDPILRDSFPFITLVPAVACAAWYGGRGPGLLALALGAMGAVVLIFEPRAVFWVSGVDNQVGLAIFVLVSIGIIAMFDSLGRAWARADEHRELLSAALSSIGDGVITADAEGRVTRMNAVAETLTGWTTRDAAGQPLDVVFRALQEETRAPIENPAHRAIRLGTVVGLANRTVLISRDGTERAIDDSAAPISHGGELSTGAMLVFRDITEQRRVAREQAQALATLQGLVASAPVGIAILDADMRYRHVNAVFAGMTGVSAEGHVGKLVAEVIPNLNPQVTPLFRRVLETNQPVLDQVIEGETRARPGETRVWQEGWFPIAGPNGQPTGVGVIAKDISQERRGERERADLLQRLSSLVDNTPLAVLEWDAFFRLRRWSGLAEKMFGWTAAEVLGRHIYEFPIVHEADVETVNAAMGDVLDPANKFVVAKNRNNTKAGDVISCEWYNSTLHDESGRLVAVLSLALDVTARQRAEERFLASQEASLFGFTILKCVRDHGGRIVDFEVEYVNPAAAEMLKRPIAGLIGHRLLAVLPRNRASDDLFDRYVRVVETGVPHDYELRYDGEGIQGWFRNMAVKLDDGVAVSVADITDRHLKEEGLRASEARFRQLAEAMPQIVWVADPSGRFVYLNRHWQTFTGRTVDEGLGEGWHALIHPADRATLRASLEESVRRGAPFRAEYRLLGSDGEYAWQVGRGVPIRDEGGVIVAWYGSSTDIDEPKRLAEALRDTDRRKDEFLATLTHELRNPLAPVRNSLELMKRAQGNAQLLEQARSVMERQIGHMVRLIDDLFDVSRITQNRLELRVEMVDLASVVQQAIEACAPLAADAGHELLVSMPERIVIQADASRLAQVFGNLLNNAIKFTEPGGRISLTARREGESVVVSVTDTGMGIPPEMLPNVFDLFTQIDRSTTRSQGGLGIGLSLVKRIVELHGGSVTVRSEGTNRGSEFVVRLPMQVNDTTGTPTPSTASSKSVPMTPRRILVVDDNTDSAESLSTLLGLMGHHTATAHDGIEAVEKAGAFQPDLILLDIGLPRLNGYEACRAIRQQPWSHGTRIVALTGWGQDEDRRKSKEAGFDAHIVKPVDPAALVQLLGSLPEATSSGMGR